METLSFYLLKSAIWISGFALVYIVFLQNERYFVINRFFLIGGILSAIVLPLITWHYTVEVITEPIEIATGIQQQNVSEAAVESSSFSFQKGLLFLYLVGIMFMIFRLIWKTIPTLRIIQKTKAYRQKGNNIIRSAECQSSFSFISFVFVNPSIDKPEINEIVKHEQEHIRQKHWIDLLLFEILRTMQWFNPIVWFYARLIMQNHEYLADKSVLQNNLNPGIYRAALLNQTFGGSIIPLTNSFNFSFNKKRFNMMNHTIQSPIRKLKLLLILPVFAGIFYAFATPEYQYSNVTETPIIDTVDAKILVGNITWEGNSVYTTDELNKTFNIKSGKIYTQKQIEQHLFYDGSVYDLYFNNGYLFIKIELIYTKKSSGTTDFTFKVREGKQVKIGKVEVLGNNKVSKEEILKVIPIKPGNLFSKAELMQSYRALVETGKFDPDQISPDVRPDMKLGVADIVISVVEK